MAWPTVIRMRAVGALFGALAVLVGGCADSSGEKQTESVTATLESAPCPKEDPPGGSEADLGPEFSCGFLVVSENRNRPGGRTIKIAIARAKAQSPAPEPDPLVYLTGGPGGSGLLLGNELVALGLNRDRDLIVVDQRGTQSAQPALTCPELDEFNSTAMGLSVQASTTGEKDVAAVRSCRDRLAGEGIDLAAFNTTENAADIADLRTALGIAEWNVYGVSYGSDVALQLLRDHPDGIRSIVVDSLVPPQVNMVEQMWPSAAEGFAALFDACAAQPECARAYPGLADEFTATVRRLAKEPAVVDLPGNAGAPPQRVVIDGYTMANLVAATTLNTSRIPALPQAIHALAIGDHATLVAGLLAPTDGAPTGVVGYGLTYGVFCREGAAFTDTPEILATARRVLPELPAEVLSLVPQVPRIIDECAVWDVGRADAAVREPVRSEVPALLLTGTLDSVTPPSQADLAAEGFPNGRVVRIAGSGHNALSSSPCAQQITLDFLDDPTGYDAGCAAGLHTPAFAD
jgi:pimeloyl-ACP methyl ester carboxylesterase